MLCREKRPPAPNVTNSNVCRAVGVRGERTNSRTACSTSLLTEVPDSAARRFSWESRRSSSGDRGPHDA